MTVPVGAFVTFEKEEGYNRAINLKPRMKCFRTIHDYELLDQGLSFIPASEPTNIIWENRQITKGSRCCRGFIVMIIAMAILVLAGVAFYFMKKQAIDNMALYANPDC